jgi:predicted RNase H-like nuclease (RuvC/YqgF family)
MEFIQAIPDALFGLIGVIVGSFIAAWFMRRKNNAEAKKADAEAEKAEADTNEVIRQTVMSLIAPLREEIDNLKADREDLKDWAERLVCQVKELGHTPVEFVRKERKTGPR